MIEIYENDDLITLKSADGEDIDFVEIAGIALNGKFYAILQPVELLEGMDDDEALVFEVSRTADGEDSFTIVQDDAITEAVFEEYYKLLDEAEAYLVEAAPVCPIFFNENVSFVSPELSGVLFDGFGNVIFTKVQQKNYQNYLEDED